MVILLALVVTGCSAASFSYDNQTAWSGSCDSGARQSPILINSNTAVHSDLLPPLVLVNWNLSFSGYFRDSGITVQFSTNANAGTSTPTILKNGVTYYVCQFHFHWGTGDTNGTEHQIDNAKYIAELHIVSVKDASYCATPGSLTDPDSVLVIGVFCNAVNTSAANLTIWRNLMVPTMYGKNNSVVDVKYSDFLPASLDYYFYNGSLTAPGCAETVQWYVLKNTIDIPRDFVAQMRTIQTVDGPNVTLPYNVRNLQPLNGRIVYSCQGGSCITSASTKPTTITPTMSGSDTGKLSVTIMILCLILAYAYADIDI